MKTKIAILLFIALIATGSGSMGLPVAILVLGGAKMFYNANKHILIKK